MIQEWCNHWCMMLNPNKTKALYIVVSRYRTVSPPHGDLVLPGISIRASTNLDILGVKFESKLIFEDHVRGIVSRVSENWYFKVGETYFCRHHYVTSLLFSICSPKSLSIVLWCGGSAAECHLKLLKRQVYSVARLCPDQSFLSLCHRRRVAGLCMLYKGNSNSNQCLFSELPSASTRVRHTRAAAAAHPLEFEALVLVLLVLFSGVGVSC